MYVEGAAGNLHLLFDGFFLSYRLYDRKEKCLNMFFTVQGFACKMEPCSYVIRYRQSLQLRRCEVQDGRMAWHRRVGSSVPVSSDHAGWTRPGLGNRATMRVVKVQSSTQSVKAGGTGTRMATQERLSAIDSHRDSGSWNHTTKMMGASGVSRSA